MCPSGIVSVESSEVIANFCIDLVRYRFVALEMRQVALSRDLEHVCIHGDGGRLIKGHKQDAVGHLRNNVINLEAIIGSKRILSSYLWPYALE